MLKLFANYKENQSMISQLQKEIYNLQRLIKQKDGIIDELFAILSQRLSEDEINSLEPLFDSMQDSDKERKNIK